MVTSDGEKATVEEVGELESVGFLCASAFMWRLP